MKDLFKNIRNISQKLNDDIIVMFSTGKDATVMLDLLVNNYDRSKLHVVYMYFIRDLSFKNEILEYYQSRYNIRIDQYPHYELTKILRKRTGKENYQGKLISFSKFQAYLREKYHTSWVAYGYRVCESIQRVQMIRAEAPDGIDWRNKKVYPVAEWNNKEIFYYLQKYKLPLTVEYSFGFRDINMPYNEVLEWLSVNYPADYKSTLKQFPFLEGDLFRWKMTQEK